MSSRALRRLREEKEAALAEEGGSGGEEESSEEEEEAGGGAFLAMLEEESSEESESESDDDDGGGGEEDGAPKAVAASPAKPKKGKPNKPPKEEEEDLDAILSDMNIQSGHHAAEGGAPPAGPPTVRSLLLSKRSGYDAQDLDLDYAMRSLLGGAAGGDPHLGDDLMGGAQPPPQGRRQRGGQQRVRRALAKKYLFGKPRTEWGRPPSYVGGGIGTKELTEEAVEEERNSWSVPWPYNLDEGGEKDAESDTGNNDDAMSMPQSKQRWFTLQMSDTYQDHNRVYQEMLSSHSPQAGMHDPNSLAMFVADHPYFAETILQLAMVLFYVNDRGKGTDLLRRCMFLYESALPSNVLPGNDDESGDGREVLMDVDRQPNAGLFAALFRIMQTSGMSGCHDSALATGRFLLSLDPLRDPMGVLLILDYYALASRRTSLASGEGGEQEAGAAFVVTLVESDLTTIHYKDPLTDRHHRCRLVDMPSWAYSYALALHRLSLNEESKSDESYEERANEALAAALERFPMILPKLLTMNKVNTKDRSFRMDWPSILPHFLGDADEANVSGNTVEERVSKASGEHLVRIFVQRCHKLWKEDSVVQWMYKCAETVVQRRRQSLAEGKHSSTPKADGTASAPSPEHDESIPPMISAFSPALARYAQCDPSEYEDAFRTFPPEAIALNPNIVAPAMALGPGRRGRIFRRGHQQRGGGGGMAGMEGQDPLEAVRQMLGLGDGGEVEVLDPDSPLLQLYLQSLLPWAQVEGVRPPRG